MVQLGCIRQVEHHQRLEVAFGQRNTSSREATSRLKLRTFKNFSIQSTITYMLNLGLPPE